MSEPVRAALRPALVTLLALATGIGGALLFAPRTGGATGGLNLQDRLLLAGTPFNAYVPSAQGEVPTVPEGRRLFVYDGRFNVTKIPGMVCTFGGHEVFRSQLHGSDQQDRQFAIPGSPPTILTAGQRVAIDCVLNGEPANNRWRSLFVTRA